MTQVKCDERPAGCSNCERLGFCCSLGPETSGSSQGPFPKKRVRQACQLCKERKVRCSAELPQCRRCATRGEHCEYRGITRGAPDASPCSQDVTIQGTPRDTHVALRTEIPMSGYDVIPSTHLTHLPVLTSMQKSRSVPTTHIPPHRGLLSLRSSHCTVWLHTSRLILPYVAQWQNQ